MGPALVRGDYRLYVAASTQNAQLVAVIDSHSHSTERRLPLGTPSPDWAHFYSVSSNVLVDLDPQTGATLRTLGLPGYFRLPSATIGGLPGGLSQNGRWLVLEGLHAPGGAPATTSRLLLVDTSYARTPVPVVLAGSFQFDAISNDGQRMYLVEYLSNTDYEVRVFNVPGGYLESYVVVDKSDITATMTGLRLSGVASPDGQWLFSVYARQNKGAFIHALNLSQPYAFCIDLPGTGYSSSSDALQWSLALSADGSHLFAANGAMHVVAEITNDPNGVPALARTTHIDFSGPSASVFGQGAQAKDFGANASVLSNDGRTLVLSGSQGIVWIDTDTLHAHARALNKWVVWSLGLSPDGSTVYALNDAGGIAEVRMADARVAAVFDPAAGQPMALIRVEAVPVP